ncbi:PREDICTED: F-box/kelch-repeat protein At5g51250-like [Camelina sativa]|uniref:F-box/kelch-repeat protein At5g51250-like n=1 Tax=Camelina sativa TaxID=90675 RepID=A0ABM0WAK4_CAMSA|nr:PREDICTED: F-box/kelch-repeat protein At5g51250-like [Camelina sativa]
MSSPETKRKKKTTPPTITTKPSTPQWAIIPSLPDDLALSIVARVSRLYYPILSLVSKSFRSLVASPELYKVRSLLGTTESCLYACFKCSAGFCWFTLCRKPDHHQTLTNNEEKKKSSTTTSGYALASVPIPNSPCAEFASMVAVGSEIYDIGVAATREIQYRKASFSSVFILDCQSHTWRTAPSLPMELYTVSVGVIDGKIYATGLCADDDPNINIWKLKNSFSLFDPKTQAWDPQPFPCRPVGMFDRHSASIDGKVHVVAGKTMAAYDVKEAKWDIYSNQSMHYGMVSNSYCQIDNVVYSASPESFRWYDTEAARWRVLQGLVGLPKFPRDSVFRLANFGGKLAVMWETVYYYTQQKKIWCAEIVLERRSATCEILGKVEWFDHVLTLTAHAFDEFISIIAVTV